MNDIDRAIKSIERSVAGHPTDAVSCYRIGILLLEKYGATADADLLGDASRHLTRAIELRPAHAPSHAALGYADDLTGSRAEEALACFREARRLDPNNRVYQVYFMMLLEETGRQEEALVEIEAAAPRHDVNLTGLRSQLAGAGMPVDARALLLNGFIRPRNFFRSWLSDEAERVLNAEDPARARRVAARERARCADHQQQLQRTFDASHVPEPLRALSPWASRYGIGDDVCRPLLLRRLSRKQRAALIREVDTNAAAIHEWLDSFGTSVMRPEAAAFMYLALGVEEIRAR